MMPTFCRHNRFIERCPICRSTVPGLVSPSRSTSRGREAGQSAARTSRRGGSERARKPKAGIRVYADGSHRGRDDGFRNPLTPGLRSSADAKRLVEEIGFASGRLLELATCPAGLYAQVRALRERGEIEHASWLCFLLAYVSPATGVEPFAGVSAMPTYDDLLGLDGHPEVEPGILDGVPLGPRTSHEAGRGVETLSAYLAWVDRAGSQRSAFTGESSWTPERRFQRIFERLALPGFSRSGRYELLVTLDALGIFEMRADSLFLAAAGSGEQVLAAGKRVFGIGDALNLERRAAELAAACGAPLAALDVALFNWIAPQRATLGVEPRTRDEQVIAAAHRALGS